MTSNNENPFQTIAKTPSSSLYLKFTILLCYYGFPHLPTLPQQILSKLFFLKKYGSIIPYLPMVWTYVQSFVVFFIWDSLLRGNVKRKKRIFVDIVQIFLGGKVWIQYPLPTYSLDICPKFRSFFIWDPLLSLNQVV